MLERIAHMFSIFIYLYFLSIIVTFIHQRYGHAAFYFNFISYILMNLYRAARQLKGFLLMGKYNFNSSDDEEEIDICVHTICILITLVGRIIIRNYCRQSGRSDMSLKTNKNRWITETVDGSSYRKNHTFGNIIFFENEDEHRIKTIDTVPSTWKKTSMLQNQKKSIFYDKNIGTNIKVIRVNSSEEEGKGYQHIDKSILRANFSFSSLSFYFVHWRLSVMVFRVLRCVKLRCDPLRNLQEGNVVNLKI
uniref:Uncharacterized protein n=1 Tax=Timema genevievae TaxID=629358 RepID=A0A7R9JTW1_TIMGE|nr:unnamed protein product [Timema genevievae]